MTFGGNTTPKRRIRKGKRTEWQCACTVAGEPKKNPAYLMRCLFCGLRRP